MLSFNKTIIIDLLTVNIACWVIKTRTTNMGKSFIGGLMLSLELRQSHLFIVNAQIF